MTSPINPGRVAWTGDNPGIYLKEDPQGPWTSLATFFRIDYSPFGMGRGVLLLEEPNGTRGMPDVMNVCIADNEALARYLVQNFFSHFAAFRVSPGMQALTYLPLTHAEHAGDTRASYQEILRSGNTEVVLSWEGLTEPYAVDMPAEKGPTRQHQMYSLFIDAERAAITINGRALPGRVASRGFDGGEKSSAFLAFSESWMQVVPDAGN